MNKKNINSLQSFLFWGCVSLLAYTNTGHTSPIEQLDWLVAHPIKSDEVDIDVTMDKNNYRTGEIPRIFISGYNKTSTPKVMNIFLAVFGPDGTEYDYPDWNKASQPWLSSYTIPKNYQLPSTFLTTMENVHQLTSGKWYVSVILQEASSTEVVSLKFYPFTIGGLNPPSDNTPPDSVINNPAPSTATLPAGALGVWDIVDYGSTYIGGVLSTGPIDGFTIIFENGSMTYDMATVLNEGVEISKAKNAKRWGNWRIVGDHVEYRWSDWKNPKFNEPISVFQVSPGISNQRLENCYGRISGVDVGDVSTSIASGYCFKPDGTFDHSSGASTNTDDAGSWGSNSKQSGQYRIDGNTITFTYGNKQVKKAIFGFLNKERTHILINIKRLMSTL